LREGDKNLYTQHITWRPKVDGLSFLSIDADESTWLEREFEEQEVWEVVRDLSGDKASWPDGFTMAFFRGYNGSFYGAS
jgi:hypothetical protein